jgi:hypothetical protein
MPKATFGELYNAFGALIAESTGRPWWRKGGIQAIPKEPYATIYLSQAGSIQQEVVENVEIVGDTVQYEQVPWGTSYVDVRVEFFKSKENDSALQAAMRLRMALKTVERYWDLWELCSLVGPIELLDISAAFRADIEPRTELKFQILANVWEPPLTAPQIGEIASQHITVDTSVDTEDIEIDAAKPVEES